MKIYNPIIIIDEDQDDLRLLSDAHKELGIPNPLIPFHACEEVLPFLQKMKVPPLLIICDYRFRTMSGLQLRSQLLEDPNPAMGKIPFVIWSSVAEPLHVKLANDLDIMGFYFKPTTFMQLQEIYSTIVRQWGYAKTPQMQS